jgi:hypothetical protein
MHKTKLRSSYTYSSPAFQNQDVTWTSKSDWKNLDYVLLDENLLPVARYTTEGISLLSWSKLGKIEFLDPGTLSSAMKDEIVVVGLTLAYNVLTALASGS